jgi:hypothetical protein
MTALTAAIIAAPAAMSLLALPWCWATKQRRWGS